MTALAAGVIEAPAKKPVIAPSYAWTTMAPLGLHEPSTIDTLLYNYQRQSVPSAVSNAYASTGNLGGEGLNMLFMERPQGESDFYFRRPLRAWLPDRDSHKFYNTRIPMTLLSYNTGGGRDNEQNRLRGVFSGNVGPKLQVGALLDYLYSKGSYANQAVNDMTWGLSGSYMGDRWELQTSYAHWNLLNKENGGITDELYITDPAQLQGGDDRIDAKSIPTRLSNAHTRLVGGQFYLNNRYKVGYWHEEQINDTTVNRTYVPVSSFIWTLNYNFDKHLFYNQNADEGEKFWENRYLSEGDTRDRTAFWSVRNTLGVSMLEGFNKWVPFGLAAYATHEIRRYTQTTDTITHSGSDRPEELTSWPKDIGPIAGAETQNLLWVGGQLTRQRGSHLRFDVTAEFGVVGPAAGEVKIHGNISTGFKLLGDSVSVTGYASFRNETAPYLMNKYVSNHFVWHNDFGKTRDTGFGGRLNLSRAGTFLDVGVRNFQNYIYFDSDGLPRQHGDNVQVFSATLRQNLHFRALHWDNSVTYQTSSDDNIISLPKLTVYSNLYLLFKIARVLTVQFGVDCDYYTRYYAPNYQPATMAFCNQHDKLIGNYPFMNAYINMKLSKARFYVMFSHVNQGLTGKNYFSMPDYPMNPRRFQIGVSVDFAN